MLQEAPNILTNGLKIAKRHDGKWKDAKMGSSQMSPIWPEKHKNDGSLRKDAMDKATFIWIHMRQQKYAQ
jgi:hypothetical protein